jgi:hypothetical protein
MSSHKDELVIKGLLELRGIEMQLQSKWKSLKRSCKQVRTSFISACASLNTALNAWNEY